MTIEERVPLGTYTTFHIGGPARYFRAAKTIEELKQALAFAKDEDLKIFILGGGSNVLVDDAGFDGLVVKIELGGTELEKEDAGATIVVAAGESWDNVVEQSVADGLWGIENLSGIPGTVGGAVVQNIGAYGQALSETLMWVDAYDTQQGEAIKLSNTECAFDYRDSIFKKEEGKYVVLRTALKLSAEPKPDVSYKDLKTRFGDSSLNVAAIRQAVLEIRRGKFPDLALEGTAGSFFKNPIVGADEAQKLRERYPQLPVFEMPETTGVKVPLAWFLDYRNGVLDTRELIAGGARLFEKQPLVIVAQKKSSSADIVMLAHEVQKQIKEKIGLDIEPEVKILQK